MAGCGGYIHGDGIVSSPNYVALDSSVSECVWFVESEESDGAILLKKRFDKSNERNTANNEFETSANKLIMTARLLNRFATSLDF